MAKQKKLSVGKRKRASASKQRRSGGEKRPPASKTQACLDLMSRPNGATLEEMREATGWQPHSVRGLLAGKIKKMPGVILRAGRADDGPRRYCVTMA